MDTELISSLPASVRILLILILAVAAHLVVRGIRLASERMLTLHIGKDEIREETFLRRYPKFATLMTVVVSAVTFTIYFAAIGLVLREFNVSLTAYLASASVIGLAIGFGSQGFVQDIVIGLTLIFSDALNVDDVVDISGQVGRVERIGLRFTTLINIHRQQIYIPNRNINIISRFRRGAIRAYVDIQLPPGCDEESIIEEILSVAMGMYRQHKPIILDSPEIFGVKEAKPGKWQYLRIKFRLWPGQSSIVEVTFKQRVTALMKRTTSDYADWMITVSYRVN